MTTISEATYQFLRSVSLARSKNTYKTYSYAIKSFLASVTNSIDPTTIDIKDLPDSCVVDYAEFLKAYSPATEQLYLQAVMVFFEFISASELAAPNLPRVRLLIRQRSRKTGRRLPQFPKSAIELILDTVNADLSVIATSTTPDGLDNQEILRLYRDRAFLFSLADTGMRVHEACGLRRGDLDLNEGQAIIIGKGNKQAIVRFSSRSIAYIRDYLAIRKVIDGASGKPLSSLPIFARHDKGAGRLIKPISRMTGWNIVSEWTDKALGAQHEDVITPHSFRHYFVTTVLKASGNLKLAQELARHTNIAVTQRYAHLSDDELDRGYHSIFNQNNQIGSDEADS